MLLLVLLGCESEGLVFRVGARDASGEECREACPPGDVQVFGAVDNDTDEPVVWEGTCVVGETSLCWPDGVCVTTSSLCDAASHVEVLPGETWEGGGGVWALEPGDYDLSVRFLVEGGVEASGAFRVEE